MFRKLLSTTNDPILTLLRLALGIVMFAHGAQKALGWFGGYGFSGTMGFFTHMGIPAPFAFLAICAEFLGGLGLLLGLARPHRRLRHRGEHGGRGSGRAPPQWALHELVRHAERRRIRIPHSGHRHWDCHHGEGRGSLFARWRPGAFATAAVGPAARTASRAIGRARHARGTIIPRLWIHKLKLPPGRRAPPRCACSSNS